MRIGSGCAHTYTLQDYPVRGCSGYPRAHTLQHSAQRQRVCTHLHAAAHSRAWMQRASTRADMLLHTAAVRGGSGCAHARTMSLSHTMQHVRHTLQCVEAAGMHALTRCNTQQCVEAAGMHTITRCRMRGATEVQGGAGVESTPGRSAHVGRVFVSWERLARGSPRL
jgi:hypothetical protein